MRIWSIIVTLFVVQPTVASEPARTYPAAITCLDDLVRMSECELLELYKNAEPGPIPQGFSPGRVITNPGRKLTVARSNAMKHVWQGKYFDDLIMTNKFFGMKIIKGQVTCESSWIDGKPSNAIDYSGTSLIFRPYRDEFREISPGIYLGSMWKRDNCNPKLMTWFAFDTRCTNACR